MLAKRIQFSLNKVFIEVVDENGKTLADTLVDFIEYELTAFGDVNKEQLKSFFDEIDLSHDRALIIRNAGPSGNALNKDAIITISTWGGKPFNGLTPAVATTATFNFA